MTHTELSRRKFLKQALALSAVTAIPSFWIPAKANALPGVPRISANDRVNIAFIGIGNRGGEIAKELYNTGLCNVVALCDVDMGGETYARNHLHVPESSTFGISVRCLTRWQIRLMP